MTLSEHLVLFLVLVLLQNCVCSYAAKRGTIEGVKSDNNTGFFLEKSFAGESEEKALEQEILDELNHLNSRKQREIFEELEKQNENFNISQKSLVFSETENLSPLSVTELKNVQKTIKSSNSSLPAIRNKRTLNFLLLAVARAMGYTLTPSNPDAEWIPRQQPPSAQPCSTPQPPCNPNSPSTPPPCSMPPANPPCPGSNSLMRPATISPNQIDANTISYPYRPARTIPLLNFAPLPAGVRVPYPPLFQPLMQQRSPCTPQPSPPPCATTPPPSPPPCGAPASPRTPPPCSPPSTPSPPPCGTTPAPSPPPCSPPSTPSPPPCGTTPAPSPPPCRPPSTPSPPPCGTTPAPSPPPCRSPSTPAPPQNQPPCMATPAPSSPPCTTPRPPCTNPSPPSAGNPPPPQEPPKKGSIILEYDDPVRIQIFSNQKKYLPASGNIFSGHDDDHTVDWHPHDLPENEKNRKNDDDFEEMEEEHIEEEEEEEDYEAPRQLKHYEEEDEKTLSNNEEEDESETNLSIVKKPVDQDIQKIHKQRLVTSKTKTSVSNGNNKKNEKENANNETSEKSQKMKKPKKKKWIRIVKKQRRKSKTDSNPQNNYQIHTFDNLPEASRVIPKYFGKRESQYDYDSYEKGISDFSDEPSSHSSEDVTQIDLKKIVVNGKEINPQKVLGNAKGYELNFNPYAFEPEDQRRKKLEKVVERYVEDYVEKQLGDELIKNTGIPKTTVFEFAPKNGPKIQTITTTVAKTSHNGSNSNFRPQLKTNSHSYSNIPIRNANVFKKNNFEENLKRRGNAASYETYTLHT